MLNNYKLDKIKNAKTLSEQKIVQKDFINYDRFPFSKDALTFDDETPQRKKNYLKEISLNTKNPKIKIRLCRL